MSAACDVSVVLSTFDRAALLGEALRSVCRQDQPPRYEVIVVDNNSTDDTARVVADAAAGSPVAVRYVFEARQGLSHARNTGVMAASAELVAFTDDDIRVSPAWLRVIHDTFAARPDVHCLGGRTLPIWPAAPPRWLTTLHWVGPLALQDYGDSTQLIDSRRPRCLAGANFAFRKSVFERLGYFSPDFARAQDTELLLRMYRAGYRALYVPEMLVYAPIEPERMTKSYHRRWHANIGRCNARMRFEELADPVLGLRPELPRLRRWWGVPTFAIRQLAGELGKWLVDMLRRREAEAFFHELRARALVGYMKEARVLALQHRDTIAIAAPRSEP